jgi:hypothetical protein
MGQRPKQDECQQECGIQDVSKEYAGPATKKLYQATASGPISIGHPIDVRGTDAAW